MKLTITRESLRDALAATTAGIAPRSTLPILSSVLLEADGDGLRVSASDLDTSVALRAPADVSEPGSVAVPAKKLQEIARELSAGPATLTAENGTLTVRAGRSRFRLNGLPGEEFPAMPVVDATGWRVQAGELSEIAAAVSFAASTEETRPILNGVLWELRGESITAVATNGHRLARITAEVSSGAPDSDLIVHPRALALLPKFFEAGEVVEVARSDNHLVIRSERARIYTRLIEGPYPNHRQVVPTDGDKVLTIDRDAFAAAVRRMAVLALDQTHRIRLALGGNTARLSVQSADLGEASDEVPAEWEGGPLEIGFNAVYLTELLRQCPGDRVRIEFSKPERAAVLTPADGDSPDLLFLLMPLRLLD